MLVLISLWFTVDLRTSRSGVRFGKTDYETNLDVLAILSCSLELHMLLTKALYHFALFALGDVTCVRHVVHWLFSCAMCMVLSLRGYMEAAIDYMLRIPSLDLQLSLAHCFHVWRPAITDHVVDHCADF